MQIQYPSSYVENSKLVEYETRNIEMNNDGLCIKHKLGILALLLLVLHTYSRMVHHKEVPLVFFKKTYCSCIENPNEHDKS